jgi:hypothetical protein
MSERQFEIFRFVDGAKSVVATSGVVGPALQPSTSYWIRARIQGDVVDGKIFLADPATTSSPTAAGSFERTLVGDDATRFGGLVTGTACIAPHVYETGDLPGWSADDWRISG